MLDEGPEKGVKKQKQAAKQEVARTDQGVAPVVKKKPAARKPVAKAIRKAVLEKKPAAKKPTQKKKATKMAVNRNPAATNKVKNEEEEAKEEVQTGVSSLTERGVVQIAYEE